MAGPALLVVAGESSGDRYAADLVAALRRRLPGVVPFGVGGDAMAGAGVELLAHSRDTAVVGLTEVVSRVPFFRKLKATLSRAAAERGARTAVLVDFSGFNLRLARDLVRHGVEVVWYVSPQVWAWRRYRARTLGALAREILVVFPFEVEFYRRLGVEATFVGHPLKDVVAVSGTRESFRRELGTPDGAALVALLPGSRRSEVSRLAPVLAGAVDRLAGNGGVRFVLPRAPGVADDALRPLLGRPDVAILEGRAWDALGHADAAVVCSGTATVEAALLGVPMVVVYRMAPLTFAVVRRLVRVPHAAMPNLLLGREVVKELLQERCTGAGVAAAVQELLGSPGHRDRMRADLGKVRELLGEGHAAERASERVALALTRPA